MNQHAQMNFIFLNPTMTYNSSKSAKIVLSEYSIVKDSSADLGVNSKIVQIRPTVKAVSTKISKIYFLHICQYFDISERK